MKVLLVSTYELGHQPVHIASPAAALSSRGVEVTAVDLAVEPWSDSLLDGVSGVAISVPMHTAMRLALPVARQIRSLRPEMPLVFYGLYAAVGRDRTIGSLADAAFCGEYEPGLVEWAQALAGSTRPEGGVRVDLGVGRFSVPARHLLPPLGEYARLEVEGEARLAGAVEASHGCRHRCRHCPIPAVYDGRFRITGQEVVMGDIAQLVAAGARHITFADPDFLNAPRYSLDLLAEASSSFLGLTFDITVKVEHLVDHEDLIPRLAASGVLFVVSAFETVDEMVLDILDKGHGVSEMARAVKSVRSAGMEIRPSWLPFTPWATPGAVAEIFEFIDDHDLAPATDPVQLAIKLLVPEGSLLEGHPRMAPHLSRYDSEALSWGWEYCDPGADLLQRRLETIAGQASDCGAEAVTTLDQMRAIVSASTGDSVTAMRPSIRVVPRLSESWFCCAEPTSGQITNLGFGVSEERSV